MAEDFEDSTQGYDGGEPSAPTQEGVNTSNQEYGVPDEYGAAPAEETQPAEEQKSSMPDWLRKALDEARAMFGINEEAVPTGGHEPAGLPKQAGPEEEEPTGLPEQAGAIPEGADSASFDRKTGTAGGVRERPRAPTQYDQPTENARAAGNVQAAGQVVGDTAKNLFGADQPAPGATTQRIREYVTGEGAEPNEQRKQREAQVAANAGDTPLSKSDLRTAALEQAVQEGNGVPALQNYRVNQGNYRGLAAAALDNGNKENATKLWNEGHTFVPDGSHAVASPTSNGIMMMVKDSRTGQTNTTMLTDNQFRDMLHNRSGEFDHLTERGLQTMLQDVARTPGMPPPQPGAGAPPMQGAGVSNLPAGANVPQVGAQSAQAAPGAPGAAPPAAAPAAAAPAAPAAGGITRPDGSRFASPVAAATAVGGPQAQKAQQPGRDPDGWPTGIPRGGQFANTKGSANRDFSQPIGFGKSGHVSSVGAPGSAGVYDVRGHTYAVGKDGLPIAKEGQPGYRGPGPGQPNWNGTQSDQINSRRPEDPRPQVIQRQPYAQIRADERLKATTANQEANRDLKREQGGRSLDLKERDLQRKNEQGGTRLDQSNQRLDQGARRLDQGDRSRDQRDVSQEDRRQQYSRQDAAKAADRVQRMDANAITNATHTLDTKYKQDGKLSPDDAALADAIRQKAYDAAQRTGAPAGGGQPGAGAGEWRINAAGQRKWFGPGQ